MSDEELEDECRSEDSVVVDRVTGWAVEDGRLCYYCEGDGCEELYDRSDLMDGGRIQKMVLAFERKNPPPWDPLCPHCEGDGCEECECEECDLPCRFLQGVNYGCPMHPVI
jgi:hypothetical protein